MRTFNRIRKQVEDRVRPPRRGKGIMVAIHDMQVYLLELKTFHVKQYGSEEALPPQVQDLLIAGEQLEEAVKSWLG